jgi:hypothetical protein
MKVIDGMLWKSMLMRDRLGEIFAEASNKAWAQRELLFTVLDFQPRRA